MEDERYRSAKLKVEEIRGFYIHLIVYTSVNVVLFLINIASAPHTLWFSWIALFWGIALCWHAFSVFGRHRLFGRDWEEKKIREIMDKDRKT